MSTKSNFGYLHYQQMLDYIAVGKIDAYDMVFCHDTREWYVVSPDNEPISVRSRIYVFSSTDEANEKLNQQTDTYEGQIVAIKSETTVTAYIVAKNEAGQFFISPLSTLTGGIDYNSLGNRPIINLIGTIDKPINVVDLDTGIYAIKGQYTIDSRFESTIYLSANSNLFMVTNEDSLILVKYITSSEITDYKITESSMEKSKIVTSQYLSELGYATTGYVDDKFNALNSFIEESVRAYMNEHAEQFIENKVIEQVNVTLDDAIDAKINEKITTVSSDAIHGLFGE